MADWGYEAMQADVLLATRFVRYVRGLGLGRFGRLSRKKLHLIGQSLGGSIVYYVANTEAALPPRERDIGDIIPMETLYKLHPLQQTGSDSACAQQQENINKDVNSQGAVMLELARSGATLDLACRNGATFPVTFHHAGCSGERELHFTDFNRIHNFYLSAVPYVPAKLFADYYGIQCRRIKPGQRLPLESQEAMNRIDRCVDRFTHLPCGLGRITIPSFYIGAAGGYGHVGAYTNTLLGSTEKQTLIVHMLADDKAAEDFGHIEALMARDAEGQVWQKMLDWIQLHDN